jgi:signal transduction histidine kinase
MLTAHATQSIGAADLMLRGVEENLKKYRFESADDFRAIASSPRVFEMLRDAASALPQVGGFAIVSLDGMILNLSVSASLPPFNISKRDYIQAHLDHADLEVFLSRTVINDLSHEARFFLTRKIHASNGQMIGILAAGIRPDFFSNFYRSSVPGLAHVTLLRYDGAPLASETYETEKIPFKLVSEGLPARLESAREGLIYFGQQATQRSFDEMITVEYSNVLPIAVSLSASREQVLHEWSGQSVTFIAIGGTLTGVLLIATLILARLVQQLEQTRNAALLATETKTRFIASISHELRTPMNAIIGGSHQLMQTNLAQGSRHFAQIVSSSARQMMVLINDLLDFSSYEIRDFRVEHASFHVRTMADEAIDMTRTLLPDAKIDLVCKVDLHVPDMLIADATRIKQVLLNLLGNAVKYTAEGKVELRLSFIRGPKNILILQVIDTGPGISPEDQTRIFEPFERTQAARALPGTGLGLTISKKLVDAMSGEIRLISALGTGTQFTVEVPVGIAQPDHLCTVSPPIETSAVAPADFAKVLQILVVEDVAPSRMLLTIMLENMGHRVTQAENGLDGLQAASEQAFDLILMDLQMPVMDGITATKFIRRQGGPNASSRILAVSANADMDHALGFADAGFDDCLLKPVAPERMNFLIASIAATR